MSWPAVGNRTGVVTVVWVGVVEKSKNAKAAEYFIDQYLSTEAQHAFGEANGVVPQSAAAAEKLIDKPLLKEVMNLTPEQRGRLYYPDFDIIDVRDWTNRWNRQVLN
jgi:ABC-type Fe3+ transport system substrate-binding protein